MTVPSHSASLVVGKALREQFLLDPEIIFLNHGSFGACPRPVFETYQNWQLELERQPVEFLARRHDALLDEARAHLDAYVGADGDNLVFVPNATVGINVVARSLPLEPGDEILTTDHEYGALNMTWQFGCEPCGARYVPVHIPLPVTTPEAMVETFWEAVTPRTKIIFLSHITSPTALTFPVKAIIDRARAAGILTVIDGAHAPGQIPLDLTALGADFYAGNCHKWLCSPKGAGFLYARREHHHLLKPLVISWGWSNGTGTLTRRIHQQGTRDIAASLSVPAAVRFQEDHRWDEVRAYCHGIVSGTRARLANLTGLPPVSPDAGDWFHQMITAPLPPCDVETLKRRLYEDYRIEIPLVVWNDQPFVRVSIQGYNTPDDAAILLRALEQLLPQVRQS